MILRFTLNCATAAIALWLATVCSAVAQTYDLQASLAGVEFPTNPSGEFTFGQYTPGLLDPNTFTAYTEFDSNLGNTGLEGFRNPSANSDPYDPNVLFNNSDTTVTIYGVTQAPGQFSLGPYQGPTAVRFTAPETSLYHVDASFLRIQDTRNPTATAYVFAVNAEPSSQLLASGLTDETFSFSQDIFLNQGESIDFVAANGMATTALQATLTAVPEPASLGLIGLGGLGLAFHRRRQSTKLSGV